jgi:AraC-like DNA-binding protein
MKRIATLKIVKKGIICIAFLPIATIFAQKSASEKDDFHYKKALDFSYAEGDSLIYFGKKLQDSKDLCFQIKGFIVESRSHYQKNDFRKAEKYVLKALDKTESYLPNGQCKNENLISIFCRLFFIYKNLGEYDLALEYLQKLEEVVDQLPRKNYYYSSNKVASLMYRANLEIDLGLFSQAQKSLETCYRKIKQVNDASFEKYQKNALIFQKAHMFNAMGNVYVHKFRKNVRDEVYLDSAEIFYKRSYDLIKPMPNVHTTPMYLIRKAKLSFLRQDYRLTLFHLDRYHVLKDEFSQYLDQVYYYKSIAHYRLQNIDSAIFYGKKYVAVYEKHPKQTDYILSIYENLAKSYTALGKNHIALEYSHLGFEKFRELEQKRNNALMCVFDEANSSKSTQIAALNDILIDQKKRSRVFSFLYLGSIPIIVLLLYLFLRKRKKKIHRRRIDHKIETDILHGLSKFEKTNLFLANKFTKQDLARYLDTNTTYLSIVLHDHKDKTFNQYISELRMQYIANKLQTDKTFTKYSIEVIGQEAGYKSASAFTRKFKEIMGTTPSKYIKDLELNS